MTESARQTAADQILREVRERGALRSSEVAALLGVSRMTAHRRLRELVQKRRLTAVGKGAAAHYRVAGARVALRPGDGTDEHDVARELEPGLRGLFELSTADAAAVNYCLTEMVNNAIDHSGARHVTVEAQRNGAWLELTVSDDGAGVFTHVAKKLALPRGPAGERDALLQLEKGKLTTMPERHSGQGLFFTSKIAGRFRLESGATAWIVDNERDERGVEQLGKKRVGTRVWLAFRPGHIPPYESVFARFTSGPENAFNKTRVTVRLAEAGEALLSRSEAKRVVAGLDKFEHVTLDFDGVKHVGQGFADEIFRVFAQAHPRITLEPVRMNDAVAFMVARVERPAVRPPTTAGGERPNDALVRMAPERFLEAWQRARAARTAPPELQLIGAAEVICGLLRARATDAVLTERLATCVPANSIHDTLKGMVLADAVHRLELHRLDPVHRAEVVPSAQLLQQHADAVLSHVNDHPKLWRHVLDDEALDRFWARPAAERRVLWSADVTG